MRLGRCAAPQVQSLFPLRTAPPSPRISPKHMDGRQARASVPIPPSPPPCRRLPARSPHPNRNAAHPPPARGAWAREYATKGTGRRHCRPAPTQESRPLGIPFSGNASVFPISPSPKTPQADGPCSWAVRRVCALPPEQKRNEARPPPARGAVLRDQRAKGTGRRHCRPPCSWGLGASTPSRRRWSPALPARRQQAPARGPAAVYPHGRPIRTETQHTRPLLVGRVCVYFEPTALSAGTAGGAVELGADGGDGDLDEYCQE